MLQARRQTDSSGAMTGGADMRAPVHTRTDATRRLAALAARRRGALVAGAVMLPLALAGALVPPAAAVGVVAAIVLWSGAWVACQVLLEECVLRDDLAEIPEVARARAQLVAPERRREIARSLRRIAGQARASRHDVVPLLVDRVGPVRRELLAVAEEIERAPVLDPRTMAELAGLVHDGARSPLLNRAVPETELDAALRRIRYRLATASRGEDDLRPAA
jgi:hypothetical protein